MKLCINCKTQLDDDELFCHECGTKQVIEDIAPQKEEKSTSKGKNCLHCGEAIEEDCTFCPFCGKSQIVDNAEEELESHIEDFVSDEKTNPQENFIQVSTELLADNKKWLLLIVTILFVIGGIYYWSTSNR